MRYRTLMLIGLTWLVLLTSAPGRSEAQGLASGIQALRNTGDQQVGETALAALALVKAGVPESDPALAPLIAKVMQRFSSQGYRPERGGGSDIYEAGLTSMLLSALDSTAFRPQLQSVAAYLISKQKPNGSWDYEGRTAGDTSISQYAVLGLWEAELGGARIHPSVWERAARWFLSVQAAGGSWNYHRDETPRYSETVSMTAAGVSSLLICQRQLLPHRMARAVQQKESALLRPMLDTDTDVEYRVGLSDAELNNAIAKGIDWLGRNFILNQEKVVGPSPYYGLYGVERVGALSGQKLFSGIDWYTVGSQYLLSTQNGGGWSSQYGPTCNTAWAVLFLSRATEKSVAKAQAKRLGEGTLLGGRGLPDDLSNLAVAQGRVLVRPMNGAIDQMLSVLEDARNPTAEEALAGLAAQYSVNGPKALRPWIERLRRIRESPDPNRRMMALWCLGRSADLSVVPDLIASLTDPNDDVVATAAYGLKLLSRKLDGFGPQPGATLDQKLEAATRWSAWYESIRPSSLSDQSAGSEVNR